MDNALEPPGQAVAAAGPAPDQTTQGLGLRGFLRASLRLALGLAFCGLWGAGVLLRPWRSFEARMQSLQRLGRRCLDVLGVEVELEGSVPAGGAVLVANHRTFADIAAILAATPTAFVSKEALRSWPLMGWVVTLAGTIYVNPARPGSVLAAIRRIAARVAEGHRVVVFAEGTTGVVPGRVLPLKHGAFRAARIAELPVVPVAIEYNHPDFGWGDENVFLHFFRLYARPSSRVRIVIGPPVAANDVERARDEVQAWLEEAVAASWARLRPNPGES